MKLFVTGGSSPLGELAIPRLVSVGPVVALTRSDSGARRVERRGAAAVRGTLETAETWADVARDADVVVHLAGMRLVDSLVPHVGVSQPLTVISSASVRNLAHPLAGDLRAAEGRLTAAKPTALVILRPTMIYGSSNDRSVRILARLVAGLPAVPRVTGGGLIQPVLADDVADAIVTTLGASGRLEADLGGPVPIRLGDLVTELGRLLRRPSVAVPVPIAPIAWASELMCRWRSSPALHALAMLQHDRSVSAAGCDIVGHAPTALAVGLTRALARYQFADR